MHEVPTHAFADLLGMWTEHDIEYIRYWLPFMCGLTYGVRAVTYEIQNGPLCRLFC